MEALLFQSSCLLLHFIGQEVKRPRVGRTIWPRRSSSCVYPPLPAQADVLKLVQLGPGHIDPPNLVIGGMICPGLHKHSVKERFSGDTL